MCAGWATILNPWGPYWGLWVCRELWCWCYIDFCYQSKNATLPWSFIFIYLFIYVFFRERDMERPGFRGFDQRFELWSVWSSGSKIQPCRRTGQGTGINNGCTLKPERSQNQKRQSWDERVAPNVRRNLQRDASQTRQRHFFLLFSVLFTFEMAAGGKKETVAYRCVITQHVCVAPTNLIRAWTAQNTCSAPAPADGTKPVITRDYSELASLCFFCPFISSTDLTKKKKKSVRGKRLHRVAAVWMENWNWRAACQRITRRASVFQQLVIWSPRI